MKNSIATIILGIALVVLGSAFTYHVFTTEIDKPSQPEAPADPSLLWTDFSHRLHIPPERHYGYGRPQLSRLRRHKVRETPFS